MPAMMMLLRFALAVPLRRWLPLMRRPPTTAARLCRCAFFAFLAARLRFMRDSLSMIRAMLAALRKLWLCSSMPDLISACSMPCPATVCGSIRFSCSSARVLRAATRSA